MRFRAINLFNIRYCKLHCTYCILTKISKFFLNYVHICVYEYMQPSRNVGMEISIRRVLFTIGGDLCLWAG